MYYNKNVAQSRNINREIFISSCPLRGGLPEANPHGKATGLPDRPFELYGAKK